MMPELGADHHLDLLRSGIVDSLINPPVTASVEALRRMWEFDDIHFVCRRPAEMQSYPELPVRLRGAFGRALYGRPLRCDRRGRPILPAKDVLFDSILPSASGIEIGKPFVIRAWSEGDRLIISLRLFGLAVKWRDEAIEAMIEALANGIALRAEQSMWVPVQIEDIFVRQTSMHDQPITGTMATLQFRSPVSVRRSFRRVSDPRSLVASVIQRIYAMAPWQGIRLLHDPTAIRSSIDRLAIDDADLTSYRWYRHSLRSGNQAIEVMGNLGRLTISGQIGQLTEYLTLAETCNTGSHAGLGLGWFDLIVYP